MTSLDMKKPGRGRDADPAAFWDRTAARYALSTIKDTAGYERTIARTSMLIKGSNAVLEIGCGTGTTALRLAPEVKRLTATDVSPAMIAIAREKAAAAGIDVDFQVARAEIIKLPDVAYDAVLAFNLLHLVTERAELFRLIHRRLRPGGLFISKTPCLSEMNPLIRLAVPPLRLLGLAPPVAFFKSVELEREIASAGFSVEECAHHGTSSKDARSFIVAQKPGGQSWI